MNRWAFSWIPNHPVSRSRIAVIWGCCQAVGLHLKLELLTGNLYLLVVSKEDSGKVLFLGNRRRACSGCTEEVLWGPMIAYTNSVYMLYSEKPAQKRWLAAFLDGPAEHHVIPAEVLLRPVKDTFSGTRWDSLPVFLSITSYFNLVLLVTNINRMLRQRKCIKRAVMWQ